MTIVKNPERYGRTRVLTAEGKVRHSATNGDAVAQAMFGMSRDDLVTAATVNGLETRMLKHNDKPNGQFRMNLGNMLRAMVRKGNAVKIGKHRVEKLDQPVQVTNLAPDVVPKADKLAAEVKTKPGLKKGSKSIEDANREAQAKTAAVNATRDKAAGRGRRKAA